MRKAPRVGKTRKRHRWPEKAGGSCGPVTVLKPDGTVEERPALRPQELRQIVKERPPIPASTRRRILARDNHSCRYCGVVGVELVMEHVVPVALGGATTMRNLVTSCVDCNTRKGVQVWKPRRLTRSWQTDRREKENSD